MSLNTDEMIDNIEDAIDILNYVAEILKVDRNLPEYILEKEVKKAYQFLNLAWNAKNLSKDDYLDMCADEFRFQEMGNFPDDIDLEIVSSFVKRVKPKRKQTKAVAFTEKQGEYLAFIHQYITLHGVAPAETDIRNYFGTTPPTVHQMIVKLTEKGLISRVPRQARSIELMVSPELLPPLTPKGR